MRDMMQSTKSSSSRQTELEKLRRELLRRIVANEARRRAKPASGAK